MLLLKEPYWFFFLDFDVNQNSAQDDHDLGITALFSDLPSTLDHTRSYHSASRKSLRRRGSARKGSETLLNNDRSKSLIRSDVAGIIDLEDGLAESELKSIPAPMAHRKSVR